MPVRIAVVGPGRVGSALGRRLAEAGLDLLGFVGRSALAAGGSAPGASAHAAVAFAGHGRVIELTEIRRAHVVVFAVGDGELRDAIAAAARAAVRPCALWLHTSGRHGLEVFDGVAAGVRRGALHPVAPFPDAATGHANLAHQPAVLLGCARARRLLLRLCEWLELVPLWGVAAGDRTLYHAACALAANGLTALRSAVDEALARSGALTADSAEALADALMRRALDACREQTALHALSGPVVRGDLATVRAHRRVLQQGDARLDALYCALMQQALELAQARGLSAAQVQALRSALGTAMD